MQKLKVVHKHNSLTVKRILNEIDFFHKILHSTKYMLSGSSVLSLIHMDNPKYDDFDLYFSNKHFRNNALKILNKHKDYDLLYKSKYAATYLSKKNKKKIQLVLLIKKSPWHLATSHDFVNCGVVFSSFTKAIYMTDLALEAWQKKYIDINTTPLYNAKLPDVKFFNQLAILLIRIQKYTQRYSLKESQDFKNKMRKITSYYNQRLKNNNNALNFITTGICHYTGNILECVEILNAAYVQEGYLKL